VDVTDLHDFLEAFIPLSTDLSTCEANVVVLVHVPRKLRLDLLPFWKVLRDAPNVRVSFVHAPLEYCACDTMVRAQEDVNAFLEKWRRCGASHASAMGMAEPGIVVVVSRYTRKPGVSLVYTRLTTHTDQRESEEYPTYRMGEKWIDEWEAWFLEGWRVSSGLPHRGMDYKRVAV
jgi:hypothetical protein